MVNNDDGKTTVRYDTEENWKNANPILDKGEIGVSIINDKKMFFVGNGIDNYSNLKKDIVIQNDAGDMKNSSLMLIGNANNYAFSIINTSVTKGIAPASRQYCGINFYGKDYNDYTNRIGVIDVSIEANNRSHFVISAYNCNTNTNTNTCTLDLNVDNNGNKNASLDGILTISNVGHTQGNSYNMLNVSLPLVDNSSTYTNSAIRAFPTATADGIGVIFQGGGATLVSSGESGSNLVSTLSLNGGTEQLYCTSDNNIYFVTNCQTIANRRQYTMTSTLFQPDTTNTSTLGASGHVWKQLFAGTTTISTSDERYKRDVDEIPSEVLDAWEEIKFIQFRFKDAYEEKGDNSRYHLGVIAQRIKSIFEKYNIDAFKYGLLCYDEWDREDNNGIVTEAGNKYSVRYEELLCLEASYQRRRADKLEERIAKLEALIYGSVNNSTNTNETALL